MEATTNPRPYWTDGCDCGCIFAYGLHDDVADAAGEKAEALHDQFREVSDPEGDTPESEAAYHAWAAAQSEYDRLMADHDGCWMMVRCPRCSATVRIATAPVGWERLAGSAR